MTRTAGAQIGCQRPSRFWGLGCPKIYHEVEDTLVSVFQLNFNDLAFIDGNQVIASADSEVFLHPDIGKNLCPETGLVVVDHGHADDACIDHFENVFAAEVAVNSLYVDELESPAFKIGVQLAKML
ncbi:hypothetical protein [Thiolapillus sp.]|uniref:hypothetical protein n=1 Tax=Thiolapillus sp. TaxID=2017437 RepID=UPI0025D985D5|nr:hypothetical protein [Thiolapillus sp.]